MVIEKNQVGYHGDYILDDKRPDGRSTDWRGKKRKSMDLADIYRDIFIRDLMAATGLDRGSAEAMAGTLPDWQWDYQYVRRSSKTGRCADHLDFFKYADNRLKLYKAWFCKDRLCPMCNWRRSMRYSVQIAQMLAEIQSRKIKGRPIFLTLTVQNVPGNAIKSTFSALAKAFKRLVDYKAVSDYMVGGLRASEITYNADRDDWHIHLHAILWMRPSYFTRGYMTQDQWTALWRRAGKFGSTPDGRPNGYVDVRTVRNKRNPSRADEHAFMSAVLEVAKYPVKPSDFDSLLTAPDDESDEDRDKRIERVRMLRGGLDRVRLISFFGVFKGVRHDLQLSDPEDGDLVGASEGGESDTPVAVVEADYRAADRDYHCNDRPLTQDDTDWLAKHHITQ